MSAFDGALAWDIARWTDDQPVETDEVVLTRDQIESLAVYLTSKGWGAAKRDVSLGDVRGLIDKGRKLFDDFLGEAPREPGKPADR